MALTARTTGWGRRALAKDLLPPPLLNTKFEKLEDVERFMKGLLAYLDLLRQQISKNL